MESIMRTFWDSRRETRFCNRRHNVDGFQSLHRRMLRYRKEEYRSLRTLYAEVLLDEFAHFAISLADRREHADLRLCIGDGLCQQRASPTASRSNCTESLPFTTDQQAIQYASTESTTLPLADH
jgi:hypothetical protein